MRGHSRRVVVASQPTSAAGVADSVEMFLPEQPDALARVLGVGIAQPVIAADRPDRRGVPLDGCTLAKALHEHGRLVRTIYI